MPPRLAIPALLTVLAASPLACRTAGVAPRPARPADARAARAGCYALRPTVGAALWPEGIALYLDSVAAPGRPAASGRVLSPGTRALPRAALIYDFWIPDAATDTVRLFLAYGMGGTVVRFAPVGAPPWRGRLDAQSDDASEPPLAGHVSVAPVPCGSADAAVAPEPAAADVRRGGDPAGREQPPPTDMSCFYRLTVLYGRITAGPRTPPPTFVTVEIAQFFPPPPGELVRPGYWTPFYGAGGASVGPGGVYRAELSRAMDRPTDSLAIRLRLRPGGGVYPVRARPRFAECRTPLDSTRVDLVLP
jgi:hypothetical protein